MAENLIPTVVDEDSDGVDVPPRTGRTMRLGSLAPKFNPLRHQVYFDLLTRAIGHEDTRNIAVTGAYGTGKSSILTQLRADDAYKQRTVGLSLSTIAPRHDVPVDDQDLESPTSRVNQIQKEIVKQLLYRTAVTEVPQSRFRRATTPKLKRDAWTSIFVGLGLSALLFLLGPLHPLIVTWFEGGLRHALAYAVTTALIIGITWVVLRIVRARPLMSASVNAASTTVTLTPQSDTYFDAYLDEIVYFFEATKTDIVVIEDIDRFEDAQVFDTLRALNGLLNGSRQIGRRIVFVYAIRDSVFEKIGALDKKSAADTTADRDHAKEALKRASRTKFFDVIIPVVPFVSPDNARDVMTKAMKSADFKIKPALIRLAARHVADMRMIHNIRNEFEVYRHELVTSTRALPDITDDLVFAVVLYKNTHLTDYEKIRHRDSALDHLYVAWRKFVTASAKHIQTQLDAERREFTPDERAGAFGTRILGLRDLLDEAVARPHRVRMDDEIAELITSEEGWSRIVDEGGLSLSLTRNGAAAASFTFNSDQLEQLLGGSIAPETWEQQDADDEASRIRALREKATFLRHHTWAQLTARDDLTAGIDSFSLTAEEEGRLRAVIDDRSEVTFDDLVDAILPSELARELVRNGNLTSHFALYSSNYYGKHLSKEAREYIYRNISPGEPDFTFELRPRDVRQILREQKANADDSADLFSDVSVLNIDIVDYLLAERPGAAEKVARQLAAMGSDMVDFLDAYSSHGKSPGALLALLVPLWNLTAHYAVTSRSIPDGDRIAIVDAVLAAVTTQESEPSREVAQFISDNYASLESVTAPATPHHARALMGILTSANQVLADLAPLSVDARAAALTFNAFPVTEPNLRTFIPRGRIELGGLRASNRELYDLILRQVDRFLPLTKKAKSEFTLVRDAKQLALLIRDLHQLNAASLHHVLAAVDDIRVPSFEDLPAKSWPAVASSQRVAATAANIAAYVSAFGVDSSLAVLLKPRKIHAALALEDARRHELAHAILRARDVIPSTLARVTTVKSLHLVMLDPTDLAPESGDLVARLLTARLIPDDSTAFDSTLMVDWSTMEKTLKASKRFRTFASPTVFPPVWVPDAVRSTTVPLATKVAIVNKLESLLTVATRSQAVQIATALVAGGWKIRAARIRALVAAGVHSGLIIPLLANDLDNIDSEAATEIMQALGGDYALVARGGNKRPSFKSDKSHRIVLERFLGVTVKRIKEEDFKRKGRRLVAYLL